MGLLDGLCTFAAIRSIGVDPLDHGGLGASVPYDLCSAVTILHAGRGHRDGQQQSECVHHQVMLAPFDLLARIEATVPPCGEERVDWTSMTAAVGSAVRPMRQDSRSACF